MAKDFSFGFNITAKLAGGFQAAFNAAKSAMTSTSQTAAQINAKQTQLAQQARTLVRSQSALAQAYKAGQIGAAAYKAQMQQLNAQLQQVSASQAKLTNATKQAANAQKAQSAVANAFKTGPITGFNNAVNSATGRVSGLIGKLNGMAAMAAGGFGLLSLAQSAIDAGEATYQLTTKMHMSAAEAGEFKRILSLTGVDVQQAGRAMMVLDKNMQAENATGEKTRAVLEQYGVSLTDANGKMLPLNEQLRNLSQGYKAASAEGKEQEFLMDTLGVKGLELAKTLQTYDEAAESASKVKSIGLDVNQMHQIKQQVDVMKMQVGQFGLAFAQAFAPLVSDVLTQVMPYLQQLAVFLKENRTQIAEFASAFVKLAVVYYTVKPIVSVFTAIKTAITGAQTAMAAFRLASLALGFNPVVLAITAVIAVLYLLYTHWDQVTAFMSQAWKTATTAISSAWESLKARMSAAGTAIMNALRSLGAFVVSLPMRFVWALGYIAGVMTRLPSIIARGVVMAVTWLMQLPARCFEAGTAFVSAAVSWLSAFLSSVVSWISNTVSQASAFLQQLPSDCMAAGAAFVAAAGQWASEAYESIMNWIRQLPGAISDTISSAWANIKATFSAGFSVGVHENAIGGIYGQGSFLTTFAERSPEAAIPIDGSPRSIGLWERTGRLLGVENNTSSMNVNLTVPVTVNGNASESTTIDIQAAVQRGVETALANITSQRRRVSYA